MDMIFFSVKAEIEEKKIVEISTGNTSELSTSNIPKSLDFKEKCTCFNEIDIPIFPLKNANVRQLRLRPQERVFEL